MTTRTFTEIHRSGPHAGKRVWVREILDATGRVTSFTVFAVTP